MAGAGGPPADFDRGRRVGKYEILTRLSIGGMAELFLAFTSGPGGFRKFVAVKQILPDVKKDPQFVKMFLDEARITAALTHANIGQVFDLGQEDGELYLAMEFIPGQNLEQVVKMHAKREGTIPVGFSAMVMRDTCLALHYAHNFVEPGGRPLPVIHRDVSPKNVMVTYAGNVKVIDFGIAKAKGRLGRTQVGIVKGTSGYMSPEQVRNEPLDGRSDLFAVGVMMHELLTGQRLFTGPNDASMMIKIVEDEVPDPRTLNPKVPAPLAEVTMRALQRPRDARFATGKELARAIEAAMPGELFDEDQAVALMRGLFDERMKKTHALLEYANRSEDAQQLDAAAGALREEAEVQARTPTPRKAPRPISRPKAPEPREQGSQRYASRVASDYALYANAEADTVQNPKTRSRRPTQMEVPVSVTAVRPEIRRPGPEQPAGKGWGGRILGGLFLLALGGAVASTRVGPLQPFARPLSDRLIKSVQDALAGEAPPPPPPPLRRTALPPQAVSLIQKEQAVAEEEKKQGEIAATAPEPPKVLPALTPKDQIEAREKAQDAKAKQPVSKEVAVRKGKLPNTTVRQHPDGEAEVLDTHSRSGAAKDGLGWLSLFTVPPTQVFDGATDLGVAPLVKVPLPAGTYRLRLVDPEGQPRMLSAPVKPGEVTTLKIRVADLPIEN